MTFYLGTHRPKWLSEPRLAGTPLFLSRNTLGKMRALPPAETDFAFDSGGFTELQKFGKWSLSALDYILLVRHLQQFYGRRLRWVAPQDWMCEPIVIRGGLGAGGVRFVGTGLSVREHQKRTIKNFLVLRKYLGDLVVPAIQGWQLEDYLTMEEMYRRSGIRLADEALVAVGSVCRRQNTEEAAAIMEALSSIGLRLHGFGFKKQGIVRCARAIESADSMAWSLAGRKRPNEAHEHIRRSREPGAFRKYGCADDCSSCLDYALDWHTDLLQDVGEALRSAAA